MAEDDLPTESKLMHPSYGLKAMEAQVYKGRQPHPTGDGEFGNAG